MSNSGWLLINEGKRAWDLPPLDGSSRYVIWSSGYVQGRNSAFLCSSLLNFYHRMEMMDLNIRYATNVRAFGPSKSLDNPGVSDAVEEFDGFPVVHRTGNSLVHEARTGCRCEV